MYKMFSISVCIFVSKYAIPFYLSSGAPAPSWRFYSKMVEVMGHRPIANNINEEMAAVDRQGRPIFNKSVLKCVSQFST